MERLVLDNHTQRRMLLLHCLFLVLLSLLFHTLLVVDIELEVVVEEVVDKLGKPSQEGKLLEVDRRLVVHMLDMVVVLDK